MNSVLQHLISKATQLSRSNQTDVSAALSPLSSEGSAASVSPLSIQAKKFINPNATTFQKFMVDAARMTQEGNLQSATAVIQKALVKAGLTGPAAQTSANVIDVEAKLVVETVKPGLVGQFIRGNYSEASAGTREYKLYVPPASFEEPLPLILMLHGCTQNPDDFAAGTGMNEAALKRGFYVLYPAQTQRANSSRCWNWFKHNHQSRGRGEPALLASMTRDIMNRYNIDPRRVYVAGLSAGGAMAAVLGDAYPDLFAAVGVHSGLATGSASNLQAALSAMQNGAAPATERKAVSPPTIVFHGDRDATVNPVNGEQVLAASAGAHTPETKRAKSSNGREYTQRSYMDPSGCLVAEHWAVHGAGHAWSGGRSQGSYTDGTGPDATAEMIRFFLAHKLSELH